MQDPEAQEKRSGLNVALALILLATSALTLPLTAGVAAASSFSPPQSTSAVKMIIVQLPGNPNAKPVLDGVGTVFIVAPPLEVGSTKTDEFGASAGHPSSAVAPAVVAVNSSAFHLFFRAQGVGFVISGQWVPNGASPGTGFTPESVLAPSQSGSASVTAAVPKVWWDFFQRRSKFEIYVDILELMKRGPMTPFEVAFYARLNNKRTKEYTEFLAEAGYLQPIADEGRALYALTKEGVGFLERVRSLLVAPGIIGSVGPDYQRDF